MTEREVACSLTPGELRCQASELLPGLAAQARNGEWTDLGMRLRFLATSAQLNAITQTIDRERACCAFLTFRLEVPAAGAELVLDVSGPEGTQEFLAGLGVTFAR
jgi:hypothetical protein